MQWEAKRKGSRVKMEVAKAKEIRKHCSLTPPLYQGYGLAHLPILLSPALPI